MNDVIGPERTIRDMLLSIHKQLTDVDGALGEMFGPRVTDEKIRDEPESTMAFVSESLHSIERRIGAIKERIDFGAAMLG